MFNLRFAGALALVCLIGLSGCGGTPASNAAAAQSAFAVGCSAVKAADAVFKIASPGLVASGKLVPAQSAQEAGIAATVAATCASPPPDLTTAAIDLAADAAEIYLLVDIPTTAKP